MKPASELLVAATKKAGLQMDRGKLVGSPERLNIFTIEVPPAVSGDCGPVLSYPASLSPRPAASRGSMARRRSSADGTLPTPSPLACRVAGRRPAARSRDRGPPGLDAAAFGHTHPREGQPDLGRPAPSDTGRCRPLRSASVRPSHRVGLGACLRVLLYNKPDEQTSFCLID